MFDPTLLGILYQIEGHQIVLPAMQRPFVWKEDRIRRLIDSLLRKFPLGAVLLWKTSTTQRYRLFQDEIDTEVPPIFNYETSDSVSKYLVLDGQQRLASLFIALKGTYNHKRMFIDVLSGDSKDKDPGDEYYDCRFLTDKEAYLLNSDTSNRKRHFTPIQELIRIEPDVAATIAFNRAQEFKLDSEETAHITKTYLRCATILGSNKALQVHIIDEDPSSPQTPLEEVLEIFARVNSGGLVLQKSDLLMSLLDLKWNDIQPELQVLVRDISASKPFNFTRDDVLKSLLLAVDSETRFDRLVEDRNKVTKLASQMPPKMPEIKRAWELLGCILTDDCRIYSERFFRGGHNSLLPFVRYLSLNPQITNDNRRKIIVGIYLSIMSGIFAGAEARMASFTRNIVSNSKDFPLKPLADLVKRQYGIDSLDKLLGRHLDLTLNIAHGGITLDNNPEELQRDHIFPRSKLEVAGYPYEMVNHYANFHFLRAKDNGNKSDNPPHKWFKNPGTNSPYTDKELEERFLTRELLEPGNFEKMIKERGQRIRQQTEKLFGISELEFNSLFS